MSGESQRTINVIKTLIDQTQGNSAKMNYTSGVVSSAYGSGYLASVYVNSEDFLEEIGVPDGVNVIPGDYVMVAETGTGDAWIERTLPQDDYSKLAIDNERRQFLTGDGTVAPTVSAYFDDNGNLLDENGVPFGNNYGDADAIAAIEATVNYIDLTDGGETTLHSHVGSVMYNDVDARAAMLAPAATDDIGAVAAEWRNAYFSGTVNAGTVNAGTMDSGAAAMYLNTGGNLFLDGHLKPATDATHAIGQASLQFTNAYLSGTVYADVFKRASGVTVLGSGDSSVYIQSEDVNQIVVGTNYMRPYTTEVLDLGGTSNKYKDAYFSGTVNTDWVVATTGFKGPRFYGNGAVAYFGHDAAATMVLNVGGIYPYADSGLDVGRVSPNRFKDAHFSGTVNAFSANLDGVINMNSTSPWITSFNGSLRLISSDWLYFGAYGVLTAAFTASAFRPQNGATYDLGTTATGEQWKDAYFSGKVYTPSVYASDTFLVLRSLASAVYLWSVGNINIRPGDQASDVYSISSSAFYPVNTGIDKVDLGLVNNAWDNAYFSGTVTAPTIASPTGNHLTLNPDVYLIVNAPYSIFQNAGPSYIYMDRDSIPTQGQTLGGTSVRGYTTGTTNVIGFGINAIAAENWSASAAGTYLRFSGVNNGATALSSRLSLYETSAGFHGLVITDIGDPTAGTHVGDRDYNDDRYEGRYIDDGNAPDIPTGLVLHSGYSLIGAEWNNSSASDWYAFQIRYAPQNVAEDGPDTTQWTTTTTLTSFIAFNGLDAGTPDYPDGVDSEAPEVYYFQVRSIDKFGNVRTSATNATSVDYKTNPEAGWSNDGTDQAYATESPTLVDGSIDILNGTIYAQHIAAIGLRADQISSGTLSIGGLATEPVQLVVFNSTGVEIGRWGEDGLVIQDPDAPESRIRFNDGILEFSGDSGSSWTTAIDSTGIDAGAVNFGSLSVGGPADFADDINVYDDQSQLLVSIRDQGLLGIDPTPNGDGTINAMLWAEGALKFTTDYRGDELRNYLPNGDFAVDDSGWYIQDASSSARSTSLGPDGSPCMVTQGDGSGIETTYSPGGGVPYTELPVTPGDEYILKGDLWGDSHNSIQYFVQWIDSVGGHISYSIDMYDDPLPVLSEWFHYESPVFTAPATAAYARVNFRVSTDSTYEIRLANAEFVKADKEYTTQWTTGITGDGITADAILLGSAPGGNNMVANSGYELAPLSVQTTKEWTDADDWEDAIANVNMTVTGTELKMGDYT